MNIKSASYIIIDGHPFIRLNIDDKAALIGEFKYSLLKMGLVPLHSEDPEVDWKKILPKISLPVSSEQEKIDLEGFTNDPIIIKMANEFWDAINEINEKKFVEGPVAIPSA